ncbi:MAG TPA: hypothetical protein VI454_00895 [Verrucomicrobiae bacterium]|jgi:hypothetical protein
MTPVNFLLLATVPFTPFGVLVGAILLLIPATGTYCWCRDIEPNFVIRIDSGPLFLLTLFVELTVLLLGFYWS